MMVRIASRALADLLEDCAVRAPEEACGLLLGSDEHVAEIASAANVAEDRLRQFEIDPGTLFAAHRAARAGGPAIVGCYHSHPAGDARPSAIDAARALDAGWIWLIVGERGESAYRVVERGQIAGRFEACGLVVEG